MGSASIGPGGDQLASLATELPEMEAMLPLHICLPVFPRLEEVQYEPWKGMGPSTGPHR